MSDALDQVLHDVGVAEVIVKLKETLAAAPGATGPLAAGLAVRAMPDVMSLFISRKEISNPMLAGRAAHARLALVASGGARGIAASAAMAVVKPRDIVAMLFPKLGLAVGLVNQPAANALREHPNVDSVELAPMPRLIRPVRVAAASPTQVTWGLQKLNVSKLWDRGLIGTGVVVGHLDTGVDGHHPALSGAIASFAEFDMSGKQVNGAKPHDSGEHGTHTAGTIAGRAVNGRSFGVAPGAQLASAMVIEGGSVITRILSGMEWIVGQRVRILSMSLGIQGYQPTFRVIIDALRKNNVSPIFAVGNEGPNTSRYPGNYDSVVSVGAFGADGKVAWFSSSQTFARPVKPSVPDLVGPGVKVISSVPGNKYAEMDGTSMATPHIAGLAALLLQAKPTATMAELENAIIRSGARLPGMTADRAGAGVPDAEKALQTIMAGAVLPHLAAYEVGKRTSRRTMEKGGARRKRQRAKRRGTTKRQPRGGAVRRKAQKKKGRKRAG
jgi:subtilisin